MKKPLLILIFISILELVTGCICDPPVYDDRVNDAAVELLDSSTGEVVSDLVDSESLEIKIEFYRDQSGVVSRLSLISSALACSERVINSVMTNITISSDVDFGESYPAGSDLISNFKLLSDTGHEIKNLYHYPISSHTPISLVPINGPDAQSAHVFTVSVTLENGTIFQLETDPITITP